MKLKILLFLFPALVVVILTNCTHTHTHSMTETKTKSKTKTHTNTKTNTKTATNTELGGGLSFRQKFQMNIKGHSGKSKGDMGDVLTPEELIAQTGGAEVVQHLHERGSAYWEGWAKYFKITKGEKPKSFMLNYSYNKQMKYLEGIDQTDKISLKEGGLFKYIQSDTSFFISVQDKNVNIVNSREDKFKTHFDTVPIDHIAPVEDGKSYAGGIQDFGAFSEGFCFKVVTLDHKITTPLDEKMNSSDYVFCCNSKEEKTQFMGILKALKLKKQKEDGIVISSANLRQKKNSVSNYFQSLTGSNGNKENSTALNVNPQDGRWVILQDWSQCSLICGGGETVLHRFCIPPIENGKPCEGESIIRKSCNTQPCQTHIEKLKKNKVVVEPPVMKVMPFSNRPQRFVKCKVKEADAMMFRDFTQTMETSTGNPTSKAPKLKSHKVLAPVRVVLNNFTVSIFESSDYYSNILTFDLERTTFLTSKQHKWCFILKQLSQEAELCSFSMNHKDTSFVEEWNYDFNLFKTRCNVPRENSQISDDINYRLKQKINVINIEIQEEKKKILIQKEKAKENDILAKRLVDTAQLTYNVLKKETSLEEMIKREEEQKLKQKEVQLKKLVETEEEKKKRLEEKIKEKELETETLLETQEREQRLKEAKKEAAAKILEKRQKLKKTITDMRKRSKITEMNLQSQLMKVRSDIAVEMKAANMKGDSSKCTTGLENKENRKAYCKVNFKQEYINYLKCKDEAEFCVVCCQHEFGQMFMVERKKCLTEICYNH